MVTLGFIGEGASEKMILESQAFKQFLNDCNVNFIPEVIDIEGGGNLLPDAREESAKLLVDKGATHIIILADKETATCISAVKERIAAGKDQSVIISVKTIESWFLADSVTLSRLFRKNYEFGFPEATEEMPIDILRKEFVVHTGRGFGSRKIRLTNKMLSEGFSIQNAASHPNCPSARYFLEKLRAISKQYQ